jgi:hypothetical protein
MKDLFTKMNGKRGKCFENGNGFSQKKRKKSVHHHMKIVSQKSLSTRFKKSHFSTTRSSPYTSKSTSFNKSPLVSSHDWLKKVP